VKGTSLGTSPIKRSLCGHPEALPGSNYLFVLRPVHIALPSLARRFVRFW
jgi:hypothetical protein